ncbi:MAG: N-acetylmuramoyl-L-alanine amidase [Hydrogenibacillus sp.]|nr:N-acetylmuramoyl-L-alanine amidase [Hydrogenibacillus sp.]
MEIQGDVVNVRRGPGTQYGIVAQVRRGERYALLEVQGDWLRIAYTAEQSGWVAGWLVIRRPADGETAGARAVAAPEYPQAYVEATVQRLNVRNGPGTDWPVITQINPGTRYPLVGEQGDWRKIRLPDGQSGWIAAWFSTRIENAAPREETPTDAANAAPNDTAQAGPRTVRIDTDVTHLRNGPTLDANIVGKLMRGTTARVIATEGDWLKIALDDGTQGWVAGWLVAPDDGDRSDKPPLGTVSIVADRTNLRAAPSLEANVIKQARFGDRYPIVEVLDDWYAVRLEDGTVAYVAAWIVSTDGVIDRVTNGRLFGKVIVVDPGHGGSDDGATGVDGSKEKALNLDVALRLEAKLKAEGATVILTRRSDVYLSLADRVARAKSAGADVFVSLHHNAYTTPTMRGTMTFYYRDFALAQALQNALVQKTGFRDLGARYGNYYVLRENTVPSALVEFGFLTNAEEIKSLRDPKIKDREAEGIVEGLVQYFAQQQNAKAVR